MTRIRTRLVVAFVIVALLPALPLTVLVRSLLERSFNPPFEAQVTETLESSLDGLRAQLEQEKIEVANAVREIHLAGRVPAELDAEVFRVGADDLPPALANFDAAREGAHRVGDWIATDTTVHKVGRAQCVATCLLSTPERLVARCSTTFMNRLP